jgi:hypothetical protein
MDLSQIYQSNKKFPRKKKKKLKQNSQLGPLSLLSKIL